MNQSQSEHKAEIRKEARAEAGEDIEELPSLPPPSNFRSCPKCMEPVQIEATLCKHCKSDLSWRRHLAFSTTTLALCTALLAVAGTAIPALTALVQRLRPTALEIVLIQSMPATDAADLMITNSGGTAVVVSELNLSFLLIENATHIAIDILLKSAPNVGAAVVLEPGERQVVRFRPTTIKLSESMEGVPAQLRSRGTMKTLMYDLEGRARGTCSMHLNATSSSGYRFIAHGQKDDRCKDLAEPFAWAWKKGSTKE